MPIHTTARHTPRSRRAVVAGHVATLIASLATAACAITTLAAQPEDLAPAAAPVAPPAPASAPASRAECTTPAAANSTPANSTPTNSTPATTTDLDHSRDLSAALEPIRANVDVPALAAVLIQGDQIVLHAATGLRTRGSDTPITIRDRFHIGSCGKAITATLCATLVDEGLLSWDTTLADAFPEAFAPDINPPADAAWRAVTLRQLLTNRSGAPADLDADGLWTRLFEFKGEPTAARRTLLTGVLARPPVHAPGTTFLYSNAGFAIAGHMAETRAGKPFEALVAERVFAPLAITTAGFGAPGSLATIDQPRGHMAFGMAMVPGPRADNPPAVAPAGTMHMTLPDWARFASLHLRAARGALCGSDIISSDAATAMHTPPAKPEPEYAMGWGIASRPWAKGRVLTHAGSNTMWYAVVWLAPERDIAILAATNQGGPKGERATDQAVAALLAEFEEMNAAKP
jgi:CubicO group peptidase (beta-lactamase class C family)